MQLSEIQSLIGSLTGDPNHDRYSLADINTELDNAQNRWNIEARIITNVAAAATLASGVSQYALTGVTGTPISLVRVTIDGIDLQKRSKSYFDHLTGYDWTLDQGTPSEYFIDMYSNLLQYISVHPTPQGNDAGKLLIVSYVVAHTSMTNTDDTPFKFVNNSNYVMRPYDYGLAYDVASRLLLRDPSEANALKSVNYASVANDVLGKVIGVFKALEAEEPKRMSGGRYWNLAGRLVK